MLCVHCVMDTSDPEIRFDRHGRCHHCTTAEALLRRPPLGLSPPARERALSALVDDLRARGRGKEFDCVIGVSGGVDSSFVAYSLKQLGLRPLAVHLDNGWNSRLAVSNIEKIVGTLGIELSTHVLDWDEFKDLQLAFLRASTPDAEVPTDHAIISVLYEAAVREGVDTIVGGFNIRTESILPRAWSQGHYDWRYIQAVHAEFGTRPLTTFPHLTLARRVLLKRVKGVRWVNLLDYLDYVKRDALQTLERELGWEPYGGKHYESIYTRFYQGHLLPTKFGYDKRRAHLSSLIVSGQCTRTDALERLREPLYDPALLREDTEFVANKFDLTVAGLEALLAQPPRRFEEFASYERSRLYRLGRSVLSRLSRS